MRAYGLAASLSLALAATAYPADARQALTPMPWTGQQAQQGDLEGARKGDVQAQMAMARRLESGEAGVQDLTQAAHWWGAAALSGGAEPEAALRRLAKAGVPQAQLYYGRILVARGGDAAIAEGAGWLRKAGDAGLARANVSLASLLAASPSRGERSVAAMRYLEAGQQDPSLKTLTDVLSRQVGRTPRSRAGRLAPGQPLPRAQQPPTTTAEITRSQAYWGLTGSALYDADRARGVAQTRLFEAAEAMVAGDPSAPRITYAWLAKACDDGQRLDMTACVALTDLPDLARYSNVMSGLRYGAELPRALDIAHALELGIGVPQDPKRALMLYDRITQGDMSSKTRGEAFYRMAMMAKNGVGGPKDDKRAKDLLLAASVAGHGSASYMLGLEQLKTARTREDWRGVGSYLAHAGDTGIADAAFRYAELILNTNTVESDRPNEDVYKYYQIAAVGGHPKGVLRLGQAYRSGWGVPRDNARAAHYFEQAARAGDPEAAWWAAILYMERTDWPGAMPWLKRAAQGGYPGAQAKLNEIVAAGYYERSLGGFFMSVLDFAGDAASSIAEGAMIAQRQHQARIDEEIRFSMQVTAAIRANGGYSQTGSSSSGSSSSGGSGGSGGSDSGGGGSAPQGSGADSGGGGGYGDAASASSGLGASGADAAQGGSSNGGADNGSGGSFDLGSSGNSGGDSGGGSSGGAIIVDDGGAAEWKAELGRREAAAQQAENDRKAQEAIDRAAFEAEQIRMDAETNARNERRIIACYGSMEAYKRAKVDFCP